MIKELTENEICEVIKYYDGGMSVYDRGKSIIIPYVTDNYQISVLFFEYNNSMDVKKFNEALDRIKKKQNSFDFRGWYFYTDLEKQILKQRRSNKIKQIKLFN